MAQKKHKPDEIVAKLRQIDVLLSQARPVAEATRPSIAHYTANRCEYEAAAQSLFMAMEAGVAQTLSVSTYALSEARKVHEDLEARRTTGSVVLLP
jgi:NADPH2:quinone reductase